MNSIKNKSTREMLSLGYENFNKGKFETAKKTFLQVLEIDNANLDAIQMCGVILGNEGAFQKAIEYFSKAIKLSPANPQLLMNRAYSYCNSEKYTEALSDFEKILLIDNNNINILLNYGNTLCICGQYIEAISKFNKAISIKKDFFEAYNNKGNALQILKRYEEAIENYELAILHNTNYAEAYNNKGNGLRELNRFEEAISSYREAIKINPNFPEAYYNLANIYQILRRNNDALINYDLAIELNPSYSDALFNQGNLLYELKKYEESMISYDKAITLKPNYFLAINNRGKSLQSLKKYDEALKSFKEAIALKKDFAEAYFNIGKIFTELKNFEEALIFYDKSIALKSDYWEAFNNKGYVEAELKKLNEALTSYTKAIELSPNSPEAHCNMGIVLHELKKFEDALVSYEKAIALNPDVEYVLGTILHVKMNLCDWSDFDRAISTVLNGINENKKVINSFSMLGLIDDPLIQLKTTQIWVNDKYPPKNGSGEVLFIPKKKTKTTVGYYSADFREHPVAYLSAELFELHDKNKFELIGFYSGTPEKSEIHSRISKAFDQFIDIRFKSDHEVAKLSRELGVDIAVDLTGLTANERIGVFSHRAAPIQMSYLGYLGSIGAEYYDYLIADSYLIKKGEEIYYKEKIIYLPSYQVNDSKQKKIINIYTRQELGLPSTEFIFCCFNNNYKITPDTFSSWMRILVRVPNSILLLYVTNTTAKENLKQEAEIRGVSKDRIYFAPHLNRYEYLSRMQVADLFLDTFPYNAGTLASDALFAGLPVLTRIGQSFPSRMAASLLNAIELPELITSKVDEYEDLAVKLSTSPDYMSSIKQKLIQNKFSTALFNTINFTRNLEGAYTNLYQNYLDNCKLKNDLNK